MLMTPPILADIGTFIINIDQLSLSTLFSTALSNDENKTISVDLKNFYLNFTNPGPLIDIEGYNDFGSVINGTGNTLLAIVRNRLVSLIEEQLLTGKINKLVNKILNLLPQDIYLSDNVFIEGLLYKNPTYTNEYLSLQVETSLHNESSPYPYDNLNVLPSPNITMDYQLQL